MKRVFGRDADAAVDHLEHDIAPVARETGAHGGIFGESRRVGDNDVGRAVGDSIVIRRARASSMSLTTLATSSRRLRELLEHRGHSPGVPLGALG
jgi:hypothetical protein